MANVAGVEMPRIVVPEGCRRFGLSDLMIVTAGAALALSMSMPLMELLFRTMGQLGLAATANEPDLFRNWPSFWGVTHDHLRNTLWYGFQLAETLLFGFTPAFLLVRLRRPRPPWRALIQQPGFVATSAMVFGLFWGTGALATWFPDRFDTLTSAPVSVGGSVAFAWLLLALGRKWQPERGWIDRMGRLLGCVAIGLMLALPLIFRI